MLNSDNEGMKERCICEDPHQPYDTLIAAWVC